MMSKMAETAVTDFKAAQTELSIAVLNNNNIAELINCNDDEYVPMRNRLPKLTEEDFRQISKCRYIRKSHRQCKEHVCSERSDTPALWNFCMKNPLSISIGDATIKEEGKRTEIINNQPLGQIQSKVTVFPLKNDLPPVSRLPIKPLVSLAPITTDMRNHLVQRKPKASATLNRQKMEELRLNFNKCDISEKETELASLTSSDNSCHLKSVAKRKEISPVKPSKRIEKLYKEISSVAKDLDISLTDVVRDVKEQRGTKGSLVSILKLRRKGLKKWSLLAKLVRSGWLFQTQSRILKQINKRRSLRKSIAMSDNRTLKSDALRFGAPRKFNMHTNESLSCSLPQLPMRFLDKALSRSTRRLKDDNKAGSFDKL